MRDQLKRLERLEVRRAPVEPIRVIRYIVRAQDGREVPRDLTEAYAPRVGRQTIKREAGETVEAFTERAFERFPGASIVLA